MVKQAASHQKRHECLQPCWVRSKCASIKPPGGYRDGVWGANDRRRRKTTAFQAHDASDRPLVDVSAVWPPASKKDISRAKGDPLATAP